MSVQTALRRQQKALEALRGPALLRLCDEPVLDDRELPTEQRYIHVDGGQDEVHRQDVRDWIEHTVLDAGMVVPDESTEFELGASELFALARDLQPKQPAILRVLHNLSSRPTEIGDNRITKAFESYEITDLIRVAGLWCSHLLKEAKRQRRRQRLDPLLTTEQTQTTIQLTNGVPAHPDRLSPLETEEQRRDSSHDGQVMSSSDVFTPLDAPEAHEPVPRDEPVLQPVDSLSASAEPAAIPDVFRQTADGWEMVFAGRRRWVFGNVKGFDLIRTLLDNPNCPIDAMTLMRSESVEAVAKVDPKTGHVSPPPVKAAQVEVTPTDGFPGVEAFDSRATQEYVREVQRLQDEARELRLRGNESAADRCRDEAEEIVDHLRRERGRTGRPRTVGSDLERARKAAYERFARALDRVADAHPDLAAHLREAVRTGRTYVYEVPDDTRWVTH
jgi:hypothetical protein